MDILKFITAGSVDDGKSTLIGRLLYDSKSILVDQLETLHKQTKNKVNGEIDLALLTDGLRAEREQGITIDVAYKYFSTPKRKFIIADAPGHIQYTRNMITGASNADCIVILIDARNGITEQTKRHSIIAALLRIPHVVVAINKMDIVGYSEDVFENIATDFAKIADSLDLRNVLYLPISALTGENIVEPSGKFYWYQGKSLLSTLEDIQVQNDIDLKHSRFSVQYVIRPQTTELHDYRGYAGKISSGIYRKGEEVVILPGGATTKIKSIEVDQKEVEEAFAPQSVVLHLEDDVDISRGDVIVKINDQPKISNELNVLLCWMDKKPLQKGNRYLLQHNSKTVKAIVREVDYRLNVNTFEKEFFAEEAFLNDVVQVNIKLSEAVAFDSYEKLKTNGSAILIDETSFATVGACIIQ